MVWSQPVDPGSIHCGSEFTRLVFKKNLLVSVAGVRWFSTLEKGFPFFKKTRNSRCSLYITKLESTSSNLWDPPLEDPHVRWIFYSSMGPSFGGPVHRMSFSIEVWTPPLEDPRVG